ncbi:MAG TPA: PEP-CTERM/exosortase system-associated acyltransferase [Spongiibacteraceae bacterium]
MTNTNVPLSLGADFDRTFDIKLADTDALRQRVFQIRHEVFCAELGYAMQNNGGAESDAHDAQSLHCLLHHRSSSRDTGCVRLVLPRAGGGGLPFEGFGLRYVDRKLLDWKQLDPTQCCEISRLAVTTHFRRRPGEQDNAAGIAAVEATDNFVRRRFPFIAVSLYHAVVALILQRSYRWIFMVVEPRLQRHLQRYGLAIRQVSPIFDYFGQRAVYVTTVEQVQSDIENWDEELKELYDNVHAQLLGRLPARLPIQALCTKN